MNRRRRSALAISTALTLALLAVSTNLATGVLPDSWTWTRNALLLWILVGFLVVLSAVLALRGAIADGAPETGSSAELEVVRVDLRREDVLQRGSDRSASVLDISLLNKGGTAVFVHEVRLENIERHPFLTGAELLSAVHPSANYLVAEPFSGNSHSCRVSQALAPQEADRFTLTLDPRLQGMSCGQTLYIFDANLVTGRDRNSIPLGRFMIPDNSLGSVFSGRLFSGVAEIGCGREFDSRIEREHITVDDKARAIIDELIDVEQPG